MSFFEKHDFQSLRSLLEDDTATVGSFFGEQSTPTVFFL